MAGSETHDAGDFATWLQAMQASLRGRGGTDVPCGSCRACCTSSQFILVRPQDRAALAVIPAQLLIKPPGDDSGARTMGYGEDGACPMMRERECTIYAQRPQTCRDYDCRVFAAAGIDAGGARKAQINARVQSWRFRYASDADRQAHEAIQAAARFIREHAAAFPGGRAPVAPSGIAVLAIETHTVFLTPGAERLTPSDIVAAMQRAQRKFLR